MSSLSSSNLLLLQKRVPPHLRLTLGAVHRSLSHFMILLFQIGIPLLDDKLVPKDMKATIIHYNPLYIIRHQPTEVEASHCGGLTMTAPAARMWPAELRTSFQVRIGRTCSDHPFQLAQLDREINLLNKGSPASRAHLSRK